MTLQLVTDKGIEKADPGFAAEVARRSHAHLERCYQCNACSSGCPGAYQMDYAPHRLLRMVQLGLKETALNSNTYWICMNCETCATRCPNDIDIVLVMDVLRETQLEEKRASTTRLPLFHNTFLSMVKNFGRVYELGLIGMYTVASGNMMKVKALAKDAVLGVKMFTRGKLAIFPHRTKGQKAIKRIFELSSKTE